MARSFVRGPGVQGAAALALAAADHLFAFVSVGTRVEVHR